MDTQQIVDEIKSGLSRINTPNLDAIILSRLTATQEWLEGKATLPRFITTTQTITQVVVDDLIALEGDTPELSQTFLRFVDDEPVLIENLEIDSDSEEFLPLARFESVESLKQRHPGRGTPKGWDYQYPNLVLRPIPDVQIQIKVRYYFRAAAMTLGNTTVWTRHCSELLIADGGLRTAQRLRDGDAIKFFSGLRQEAYSDYRKRLTAEEMAGLSTSRGED